MIQQRKHLNPTTFPPIRPEVLGVTLTPEELEDHLDWLSGY